MGNTFSPEQIEEMKAAFRLAADNIRRIMAQIVEGFKRVMSFFRRLYDAMLKASSSDNPHLYHMYKHAKRRRVRKKYERKLEERLHYILSRDTCPLIMGTELGTIVISNRLKRHYINGLRMFSASW